MTLPTGSTTQSSMSQIAEEFGDTRANGEIRLGDYKKVSLTSNYPQGVGELSFPSIDGGGQVPTSGQISINDFKGTRLQQVVNFWSNNAGGNRLNAKTRYNSNGMIGSHNEVTVVGGYRSRPSNSSGTRVHIHVNKNIGSDQTTNSNNIQRCALRTGNWNSGTELLVEVAGGTVIGAGGNGGNGQSNNNGLPGKNGSSGLGIEVNNCTVNVASGGVVRAGFGGGGGNNENQAYGQSGGSGGQAQGGPGGAQGGGGANGAAIRRTSGFSVSINNSGTIAGDTTATGVG